MKIYMDWEFLEDGTTIAPISVALVREDGREYYGIFEDDQTIGRAMRHDWLRHNVLPSLPVRTDGGRWWWGAWDDEHADYEHVKPADLIRDEVRRFIVNTPNVELWGWYSAYDHVCLAQLFGRMIDLPTGIPMWTNDLRQESARLGDPRLPEQESGVHNALADARHIKVVAEYLATYKPTPTPKES